jgi:hypothetical protein
MKWLTIVSTLFRAYCGFLKRRIRGPAMVSVSIAAIIVHSLPKLLNHVGNCSHSVSERTAMCCFVFVTIFTALANVHSLVQTLWGDDVGVFCYAATLGICCGCYIWARLCYVHWMNNPCTYSNVRFFRMSQCDTVHKQLHAVQVGTLAEFAAHCAKHT